MSGKPGNAKGGTRRDGDWSLFAAGVATELRLARRLHPKPLNSLHEAYAVMKEELEEFWDEVKKKPGQRDVTSLWVELMQLGAMCQRTAEDVLHPMKGGRKR